MAATQPGRRTIVEAGLRWSWATLRCIDHLLAWNHEVATGQRVRFAAQPADRESFWELKTEAHFCLVAAHNMLQAVDLLAQLGPDGVPTIPPALAEHVTALRHCFEHWDDPAGRSQQKLAELVGTDATANTYGFGPDDALIAGLSVGWLQATARDVHDYLVDFEQTDFVFTTSPPQTP